jgi:hypothetical protein
METEDFASAKPANGSTTVCVAEGVRGVEHELQPVG